MTICPIAIAVGCKRCPAFSVCPLKGTIGDYRKDDADPAAPAAGKGTSKGSKPAAAKKRDKA